MPESIGPYLLQEQLGIGSMGAVYRAIDERNGTIAALKFLPLRDVDDESRQRFFRGARLAAKLAHPQIQKVYDFGEKENFLFIASEFLEGRDLKSAISAMDAVSQDQKTQWMIQMCNGLDHAHKHGVIHRDIKPGNVFVRTDGSIVITDFGIARGLSSDITRSGVIIGTPEYLSPEQILVTRLDHRTDIFSLGIVFYELFTGVNPFRKSDMSRTLHAILNEQPDEIHPVITKMLQKDRNARYQTCSEVAKLLAQ